MKCRKKRSGTLFIEEYSEETMLKLILGRAGTGKSRYLIEKIKQTLSQSHTKCILLVPEQFTLQSEELLFRVLGQRESMRVEVLSFRRLTNFIFRMTGGGSAASYADDASKLLIMGECVEENEQSLRYFKRSVHQPDFLLKMLALIDEMKAYQVDSAILEEASKNINDELSSEKYHELALLYQRYEERVTEDFSDFRDDFTKLAGVIRQENALKGYSVFLDSFMGFTPQEFSLLLAFCLAVVAYLYSAKDVSITAALPGMEGSDRDKSVFFPIKEMVNALVLLCQKRECRYGPSHRADEKSPLFTPGARVFRSEFFKARESRLRGDGRWGRDYDQAGSGSVFRV